MNSFELSVLRKRLAQQSGYRTHAFSYRSVSRALPENARRLRRFVDDVDAPTVHLVGHSLGGVLALQMLNLFPTDKVGRIVCLGSPLAGSSTAHRLSRWRLGRKVLGRTLSGGVLENPLVSVDGSREVGVIAGSVAIGLGSLIGKLETPHDGVVAVRETRLSGLAAHVVLPVNHFALLFSRRVVAQTVHFLRSGEFR